MSNAYPRRRYTNTGAQPRRSQITDEDLRRHGLDQRPAPAAPTAPAKPAAPATTAAAKLKQPVTTINPRLWRTIELVTDRATGTRKSTRILGMPGGVLVNTCTRSSAGMSEALVFVPGATLADFPA